MFLCPGIGDLVNMPPFFPRRRHETLDPAGVPRSLRARMLVLRPHSALLWADLYRNSSPAKQTSDRVCDLCPKAAGPEPCFAYKHRFQTRRSTFFSPRF